MYTLDSNWFLIDPVEVLVPKILSLISELLLENNPQSWQLYIYIHTNNFSFGNYPSSSQRSHQYETGTGLHRLHTHGQSNQNEAGTGLHRLQTHVLSKYE